MYFWLVCSVDVRGMGHAQQVVVAVAPIWFFPSSQATDSNQLLVSKHLSEAMTQHRATGWSSHPSLALQRPGTCSTWELALALVSQWNRPVTSFTHTHTCTYTQKCRPTRCAAPLSIPFVFCCKTSSDLSLRAWQHYEWYVYLKNPRQGKM